MRLGNLGRLSDIPLNGQMLGSYPNIPSDLHRAGHPAGGKIFVYIVLKSVNKTRKEIEINESAI